MNKVLAFGMLKESAEKQVKSLEADEVKVLWYGVMLSDVTSVKISFLCTVNYIELLLMLVVQEPILLPICSRRIVDIKTWFADF